MKLIHKWLSKKERFSIADAVVKECIWNKDSDTEPVARMLGNLIELLHRTNVLSEPNVLSLLHQYEKPEFEEAFHVGFDPIPEWAEEYIKIGELIINGNCSSNVNWKSVFANNGDWVVKQNNQECPINVFTEAEFEYFFASNNK